MTVTTGIPTLDLAHFTQGADRNGFVQALGQAYEDIGFVAVKNHGLDQALQDRLYAAVQQFFALPDDVKMKYDGSADAGQRGYTPRDREHAKGRSVGDLKEFYHVGQDFAPGDPMGEGYPLNIWPTEIPDFQAATLAAYRALEDAGRNMLRAIALYLELEETYFDEKIRGGDSILRPIHYYPIEDPASLPPDAVRSAEHEDINLITLLMGASAEGLQVLSRQGEWVAVTAIPECVVINVGDMLQRLTNNRLRSTTHRVVNPPAERAAMPRYSVPFFLHPRKNMDLTCLPTCVTAERPKAYDDITSGEYLNERLREIGLLRAPS